jgi:ABC-type dipeptide/oligopeptide/nickel transport system permease subunit
MKIISTVQSHTPAYYIRKRLFSNKPAMFGLVIILLSILIAVLGYLIMPDNSPNANNGAIQIQKQTPGFSTIILKKNRNVTIYKQNIFQKMLYGQECDFTILPIKSYKIEGFNIELIPDGRIQIPETYPLMDLVFDVENGIIDAHSYQYRGDTVFYKDLAGNKLSISRNQLIEKFKTEKIADVTYLLGTDKAGRDMLSRLIFGTRISLGIGLVSVIISLLLGVTIGSIGGFFGGKMDDFIMWLMTVVWSIPGIMLVIAISLALQSKGIWVAFVAVGLTTWVEIARVVRGQILSIKEKTFVEAARSMGFSDFRIIFRHILPNLLGPIIVIATSNFASAILTEAGLSFLGLGVQPPMPSWGMMVNDGFHSIGTNNSWHLILLPSFFISIIVFAFNLFGNGLRDAYDPQVAAKW